MAQAVQSLPSKHKAQSSNPSTGKKNGRGTMSGNLIKGKKKK
jgi:hypothetical protein